MRSSFDSDKSFWQCGRWCYVGGIPHGSRAIAIIADSEEKPMGVKAIRRIDVDSCGPRVIYLQGCWGIGKSSALIHALSAMDSQGTMPDTIVWIEDGKVLVLEHNEAQNNWILLDDPSPITSLTSMQSYLIANRTVPLLIICTLDAKKIWGKKPERLIRDVYPKKGTGKYPWYVCVEYFKLSKIDKNNISATYNAESAPTIYLQGFKEDDSKDEIDQLICARTPTECQHCCDKHCVFDKVSYLDTPYTEVLLQEIRRWGGQHPYALHLVCYALDKYCSEGKYENNQPVERNVRQAIDDCYAEFYPHPVDELAQRINEDFGDIIRAFLLLPSIERQINPSIDNRDVLALQHAGLLFNHNGNWDLIKILQGVIVMLLLRDLLKKLDDTELDSLCLDNFSDVYQKFSRGLRRDEKINLLLDHCRRNPQEGERLRKLLQDDALFDYGLGASVDSISKLGGTTMDELLALTAGLQFAYWFWNATVQPGMTRFSDRIGGTLGEISSAKLYSWFGINPNTRPTEGGESKPVQQERIDQAKRTVSGDTEWPQYDQKIERQVRALLREPGNYLFDELEIFWSDHAKSTELAADARKRLPAQHVFADELVRRAILGKTLPDLIVDMRRVRA